MRYETLQEERRAQQRKVQFQKHKNITECVRMVIRRTSSCRISSTTHHKTEGAVANTEGERVHLLLCIVVTAPVFQVDTS